MFAVVLIAGVVALAQEGVSPAKSLEVVQHTGGFAAYLVDQDGRTVYFSLNDRDGKSVCSAVCLRTWTPLIASDELTLGEGIDAAAVGRSVRDDGSEQVTYFGRPLYVLADVEASTGTDANGTGGLWFLIGPDGERAKAATEDSEEDGAGADTGSGWFTADQAQRGKRAYEASCAVCHHISLLGEQYAPALKGPAFLRSWGGQSVGDLYTFVHERMPLGSPGSLSDQQYIDIVAYILSQNELPTGGTELMPSVDQLSGFTIPAATE